MINCGENNGIIVEADGVSITGINVTNSEQGITLHGGYASIAGCNISDSARGIYIGSGSSHNEISDCNITSCSDSGIYLDYGSDNYIHDNDLTFNSIGLLLKSANYNTIVGNYISGNTYRGIQFLYGNEHV